MALIQCPSCAGRVSHLAAACPRCGYPIAVPPPPPRSSSSTGVIVLVVALVGGVGVVMVIGVLAALAIPRFARATDRAREAQVRVDLQELYELQQAQLASTGAYAANLSDPAAADYLAGWEGSSVPDYYYYSVSFAAGDGLCLEAIPQPDLGGEWRVLSMDSNGTLYGSASCRGEVLSGPGAATGKPEPAPDSASAPAAGGKPRLTSEGVVDPTAPGAKPPVAPDP